MKPQNKTDLKRCLPVLVLIAAGVATTAQAFTFQTPWPPSPMGTSIQDHPTLDWGIKYIYEWGIGLGGVAVFIVLVMAGFQYITSVGDPTKMKEAFKRIEDAVVGLLVLLSSWAILNFVGLNLSSIKIGMFTPVVVDPVKHCKGEEGQQADQCCETTDSQGNVIRIEGCIASYWTCAGSSADDADPIGKGTCQPNTKSQDCVAVKIYYEDDTSLEMGTDCGGSCDGPFNKKTPLTTSKTVTKMERWYHDEDTGTDTLCYDSTNPDAKDATAHKACNCSVQLLTKISSTQTGGTNTDQCSNTAGREYVVNTTDFVSSDNAVKVVCVLVNAPTPK